MTTIQEGPFARSELEVRFSVENPRRPEGTELLQLLAVELARLYPEEAATLVPPAEMDPPIGAFVVARRDGSVVGCGAFRRIDGVIAEVKHMYVVAAARGTGVGRALLNELERRAGVSGYAKLRLETGVRQHAALGLYRSEGYRPIDGYAEFVDKPLSACFEKELGPP